MKHTRKLALLLTLIMLSQSIALTGCSDNTTTETGGSTTTAQTETTSDTANETDGETAPETTDGLIGIETNYFIRVSQREKFASHLGAFSFGNSINPRRAHSRPPCRLLPHVIEANQIARIRRPIHLHGAAQILPLDADAQPAPHRHRARRNHHRRTNPVLAQIAFKRHHLLTRTERRNAKLLPHRFYRLLFAIRII